VIVQRARLVLAVALLAGIVPRATAQTYYVVVSGIGGDPTYTRRFTEWGDMVVRAARSRWGVPDSDIVYLGEHPDADSLMSGPATKQRLTAALQALAGKAGPEADVFLVLFGHGSDRGDGPRFNLMGPDITGAELSALLAPITAGHMVVVDASSASGGVVAALSGAGRVVVTATKSGFERNAAQFGGFFAAALAKEGADTDKDGRVSVLEAFTYARREVARAYATDNRLLTEHAVLDDNGDGDGSTDAGPQGPDGLLAATFTLGETAAATAEAAGDEALARLYTERDQIQARIDSLRTVRDALSEDEYLQKMEPLLVELGLKNREIKDHGGEN
jgi:hypothetical protein